MLGALNIVGKYHEKAELSFTAMILLHVTALIVIFYRGQLRKIGAIYRHPWILISVGATLLFLVFGFLLDDFGKFFEFENMLSLPYAILAVVPSVLYVVTAWLLSVKANAKKQETSHTVKKKNK